jgi:MFS transporter, ACS family, hexuronate transporter
VNRRLPKYHPWITEEEKAKILAHEQTATSISGNGKSWGALLTDKSSYAVILGRFFLDPVWWMFVAWLPLYLSNKFQLDIKQVAFSAWVPYVGAAVGAILGGWYSGKKIKAGTSVSAARLQAILIGAAITLPAMIAAAFASSATIAVLIMTLILGGFQFSIVNIQTLPSDYHAGKSVGSLAGLGGAAAVLGTIICMFLVPYITTNNSWEMFFVLGALLIPMSIGSVILFRRK